MSVPPGTLHFERFEDGEMKHRSLTAQQLCAVQFRIALRTFLRTGSRLDFTVSASPRVSIIIAVHHRAEFTLKCLQTLLRGGNRSPFEIIVVDNASIDETGELLGRTSGVRIVRNSVHSGFAKAVNQGARVAYGEYLLLLSNEAEVLGRSVDTAVDFLDEHPDVGVAGGKIVRWDGTLEEAGCGIWQNGEGYQHGRGETSDNPAYAFRRDVDYCSATFLMTRGALFQDMGGLDEAYASGYFKDADYCIRVGNHRRRVVFLPEAVVLWHKDTATSSVVTPHTICQEQLQLFLEKHHAWLSYQARADVQPQVEARIANDSSAKILLVYPGEGGGDIQQVVRALERTGCFATVAWLGVNSQEWSIAGLGLPDTTEVIPCQTAEALGRLLESRIGYYDILAGIHAGHIDLLAPYGSERTCVASWANGVFRRVGPCANTAPLATPSAGPRPPLDAPETSFGTVRHEAEGMITPQDGREGRLRHNTDGQTSFVRPIPSIESSGLGMGKRMRACPLVSILIPSRGEATLLHQCLESVFGLTVYRPFEVLVGVAEERESDGLRVLEKYPIHRVSVSGKSHATACQNNLARKAQGAFFVFLDEGAEPIAPTWIERLLADAEEAGAGAVGHSFPAKQARRRTGGGVGGSLHHTERLALMHPFLATPETARTAGACLMVRAATYSACGGLNEEYRQHFAEADLCLRLSNLGYRNIWLKGPPVIRYVPRMDGVVDDLTDWILLLDTWGSEDPCAGASRCPADDRRPM